VPAPVSELYSFPPSPLLAPFVSALWVHDDLMKPELGACTVLPDTATYICFLCGDHPIRATHRHRTYTTLSGVSGFQTYRFDLESQGVMTGVTVRLTPWGLNAFLGDAVGAVAEIRADCCDLFPPAAVRELEDRLFRLNSPKGRAQCVENFLLARLRNPCVDELARAACLALARTSGALPIKKLARDLDMGERTLVRRFQNAVGTTPKKYARVLRLRDAVYLHNKFSSWTEIAHVAGYCDQSHLIRECQDIFGASPETLFPIPRGGDTGKSAEPEQSDPSNSRLVIAR